MGDLNSLSPADDFHYKGFGLQEALRHSDMSERFQPCLRESVSDAYRLKRKFLTAEGAIDYSVLTKLCNEGSLVDLEVFSAALRVSNTFNDSGASDHLVTYSLSNSFRMISPLSQSLLLYSCVALLLYSCVALLCVLKWVVRRRRCLWAKCKASFSTQRPNIHSSRQDASYTYATRLHFGVCPSHALQKWRGSYSSKSACSPQSYTKPPFSPSSLLCSANAVSVRCKVDWEQRYCGSFTCSWWPPWLLPHHKYATHIGAIRPPSRDCRDNLLSNFSQLLPTVSTYLKEDLPRTAAREDNQLVKSSHCYRVKRVITP